VEIVRGDMAVLDQLERLGPPEAPLAPCQCF
jgi:hypothetical protein